MSVQSVHSKEMVKVISATKARNSFFAILNAVIYRGEEFIVEKKGEGRARIRPVDTQPSPKRNEV